MSSLVADVSTRRSFSFEELLRALENSDRVTIPDCKKIRELILCNCGSCVLRLASIPILSGTAKVKLAITESNRLAFYRPNCLIEPNENQVFSLEELDIASLFLATFAESLVKPIKKPR